MLTLLATVHPRRIDIYRGQEAGEEDVNVSFRAKVDIIDKPGDRTRKLKDGKFVCVAAPRCARLRRVLGRRVVLFAMIDPAAAASPAREPPYGQINMFSHSLLLHD
jgi:hypothetical protein